MLTYSLYDKTQMNQWDAFVESHPNGTSYHLSCWLRTIHEAYSFKPFNVCCKERQRKHFRNIAPFLGKEFDFRRSAGISPFFRLWRAPVFGSGRPSTTIEKDNHEHGQSAKYIEIRSKLAEGSDFIAYNHYKRHILNLDSGLSVVNKKINKRTIQYSIRKAEKTGVEIVEENSQMGMDEFYRLNVLTREKTWCTFPTQKIFDKLLDNVISKDNGFILLAVYNSKAVASSLFLKFNNTIHYKYNASDPVYMRKVSPNHLLTYHAIRLGCQRGIDCFDFGRTSPDNHGLMRYKKMWGSKVLDMPYYYYPQIKGASATEENSRMYRGMTNIWRSLPNPIKQKIGPMVYKHTA